jgi:hypothetical protein
MQRQALSVALATLAVGAITGGVLAAASAKPVAGDDLHNARYCEILELRGAPPDAQVTVWNTIGFNDCPQDKWDAIDAGALATERGDAAVVKNGPRYFLMDAATAEIGETHTFGALKMRKVATIPIRSNAELAQTPYTERTIKRHNTWTWNAGRRVYELLAPDGSTYVMQSYSQIRDPQLSIGQLRGLGSRLQPPQGWEYRSVNLKRDLTLVAKRSATIVQDDLTNTYQLLPDNHQTSSHDVHVTGMTRTTGAPAPGTLHDEGTISGPPFGSGTIALDATLANGTATGPFTITSPGGQAFGTFSMAYVITDGEIDFNGEATFTGGTGEYRGISGDHLKAHDHNTLDGQNGTITLDGQAEY